MHADASEKVTPNALMGWMRPDFAGTGRGIVAPLRTKVATRENPPDIAEVQKRVGAFGGAFRKIR
jgi:hypothetical protein